MQLSALSLALTRAGLMSSFSPAALFTGTTTGAWYDPSDTTTLFRDAAGTLPVTAVEQPVGLMLDKSKGLVLGSELVTNGGFDTNLNGWTPQATVTASRDTSIFPSGALKLQVTSATSTYVEQSLGSNFVPGRKYKATATVYTSSTTPAGAGAAISFVNSRLTSTTSVAQSQKDTAQTLTIYFTATNTTHSIYLAVCTLDFVSWGAVGSVAYFDNISVRELPGNHAFNGSGNSANFPVLSARYNLLTKSEDFTGWSISNSTLTTNTITSDGVAAAHGAYQAISATNSTYVFSVEAKPNGTNFITLACNTGTVQQYCSATFNVSTGVMTKSAVGSGAGAIVSTSCVASVDGYHKCTIVFTLTVVNANIYLATNGTPTLDDYGRQVFTQSGLSAYVRKADLRVANDALGQPAYQRVNTSTDYDTVGFKPYLRFNGTNQWLQTNSIDFSYGDKMFVSAGLRYLTTAEQVVLELSVNRNTNNGTFISSVGNTGKALWASKGTAAAEITTPSAIAAPITNVFGATGDISGDSAILRINGAQAASSTADQGTGNYGNYPLYLGRRGGSSLWFNGRLYGLVVAGKQASAAEITSTETYINQKTGAF